MILSIGQLLRRRYSVLIIYAALAAYCGGVWYLVFNQHHALLFYGSVIHGRTGSSRCKSLSVHVPSINCRSDIIRHTSCLYDALLIVGFRFVFFLLFKKNNSRVARGDLVLRHSVPHFLPNSGRIAC